MENFREKRLERQLKSQQTTSIVIGIILLLSILGNVYLVIRSSRIAGETETIRFQRDQVIEERNDAEERSARLESEIENLEGQVSQLRETAATLESQIQTRDRQLAQLRRQFPEIEEALEEQVAEFQQLEEEYRMLEEEREQLLTKLESLDQELANLRNEFKAQTELIDRATYLQAYNISVVNLRDRWLWGRPVIMDNASRVTRTEVSFEINSNILVEPAVKDVHLIMIDPEGEIVNRSEATEPGPIRDFTQHTIIDYDQQAFPLAFSIELEDGLQEGTHTIEVYIDGNFAGRREFNLE